MGGFVPGFSPGRPWDGVIAQSSYGRGGLNAEWWRAHFELPCTLASSAAGAARTIRDVEGQAAGSIVSGPTQGGNQPPTGQQRTQPRGQTDTGSEKEVCKNWNNRTGRCARDGVTVCHQKRAHICEVCGGPHRAIDVHTSSGEAYAKGTKRSQHNAGGGDQKKWGKY